MMHHNNNNSFLQFRSHSQEKIVQTPNRRFNSSHSVDLFTLVVPTHNGSSSLSSLSCSICSLPMMKPTLLPCQHTFCFKCIQNIRQIRPGSLPIHSNNTLSSNDNQINLITCPKCSSIHRINSLEDLQPDHSIQLLINTLLCETCYHLYPSNQLDTCLHCFGVLCPNCYQEHIDNHRNDFITNRNLYRITSIDETVNISMKSDAIQNDEVFKAKSLNTEEKLTPPITKRNVDNTNNQDENTDPSQIVNTKKKSTKFLSNILHSSGHRHSTGTSTKKSTEKPSPCLTKKPRSVDMSRQSKLCIDIKIEDTSPIDSSPLIVPITPVSRFKNFNEQYIHTIQHISQCKQRQSELDRSVKKLIEVLTEKTKETINQISQYWMYLKELALDQYQEKTNRFQLFDYLLKTCCSTFDSRKQIEAYCERNDEIHATLQVLLTTIVIVREQQTLPSLNQSFDREEQTTIGRLQRHLELLLSAYSDELSFILERINVYESRFAAWKNHNTTDLDSITYEWSQIIEHDYPSLVEKISNDFITKIPQTEKILVEMLKNMKKRLLKMDNQETSQRTSIVNL